MKTLKTILVLVAPLVSMLLLGPLARFADAVSPLAPTVVGGKEYSNALDETADGIPDAHQTIWWDGAGAAADMEDYTSDLPSELQRTTQIDALGMIWDRFYMEVSHDDAATMLVSFSGSPDIYYTAPVAHAPVHGAPPKVGVWAAAATINHDSRPDDVDGLEVWGPEAPYSDVNRFSLAGDPVDPGTGQRVSAWTWVSNATATPFVYAADIAMAIGREDLVDYVDLDAIMVYDSSPLDSSDLGKFTFAGDPDLGLPPDRIMFSIAPVVDPSGNVQFDGGEIWVWDYAGRGSLASFLIHGGETWDTAHSVAGHFGLTDEYENINALEAIPELCLLGDANNDGVVSADDYASVQSHFGDTGDVGIPGDANCDGLVSADDYASVQSNFGTTYGMGGATVPEPATLSLLAIGGMVMLKRRNSE